MSICLFLHVTCCTNLWYGLVRYSHTISYPRKCQGARWTKLVDALNQYAALEVENWTGEWVCHAEDSEMPCPNLKLRISANEMKTNKLKHTCMPACLTANGLTASALVTQLSKQWRRTGMQHLDLQAVICFLKMNNDSDSIDKLSSKEQFIAVTQQNKGE